MKCADALKVLEFLELDHRVSLPTHLRVHLDACNDCAIHYATLIKERRAYTAYNATLAPTGDLWHRIEARIQPKPPRLSWLRLPNFMPVPAFAAAAIALVMFAGMIWFRSERAPHTMPVAVIERESWSVAVPAEPIPDATVSDATPAQPVRVGSVRRSTSRAALRSQPRAAGTVPVLDKTEAVVLDMEEKYTAAIASLSRELERQRKSISRTAISQYELDLPQIDAEIQNSRQAVRDQRYEPAAILSLNEAYDRKIDLLRNVVGK